MNIPVRLTRVFFLAAILACSGAPVAAASPEDRFEAAMEQYQNMQYKTAYATFIALADDGHEESARIALLMTRLDVQLFGGDLPATPAQKARWLDLASRTNSLQMAGAGR